MRMMNALLLLVCASLCVGCTSTKPPTSAGIEIRGDRFYRHGAPLLICCSFYEYHPVGRNPWDVHPPPAVFRRQIRELKAAGFNAIRWFNVTPEALRVCREEDMLVFVQFWVDQNGDFRDDSFRRANVRRIRDAVRTFCEYDDVILGYLVMNEPYVHTAATDEDIEVALDHLVELKNVIQQEDPNALVSFVNWPPGIGLDLLDNSPWDFIAYNVYNWSPVTTSDAMGYRAYLEYLRENIAKGRPLVLMEYGASVAPDDMSGHGYGGLTEEEQAKQSVWMLSPALAAGIAGATYTHYADQIWKTGSNAEHDRDAEEWFGMYALDLDGGPEMEGRFRPVFFALKEFHKCILIEPAALSAVQGAVPVRVRSVNARRVRVRVDSGRWVKLRRSAGLWWEGQIDTTKLTDGLHKIEVLADLRGGEKAECSAHVVVANILFDPYALDVDVEVNDTELEPGEPLVATVTVRRKDGSRVPGATVHWGIDRHSDWDIDPYTAVTDASGIARIDCGPQYNVGMMTFSAGVDVNEGPYQRRFGDLAVIKVGM